MEHLESRFRGFWRHLAQPEIQLVTVWMPQLLGPMDGSTHGMPQLLGPIRLHQNWQLW